MYALMVCIEKYFFGIRNFFPHFFRHAWHKSHKCATGHPGKILLAPQLPSLPTKKSLEKEILECTGRKEGGTISISASTTFRIFIFHFRLFFVAAAFVCGSYSRHSLERFFPFSFFSIWEVDVGLLN